MSQPPPTSSQVLQQEILDVMDGPDRPKVFFRDAHGVPDGLGAVWLTNNRLQADTTRKVCVVRRGAGLREIGFIYDLDESQLAHSYISFASRTPPFLSMREVFAYLMDYLLSV